MATLALIGFIGGLVTGISPCILPVLPVIFFSGGAQSARTPAPSVAVAGAGTAGTGSTAVATRPAPPPPSASRPFLVIAGLVVSFSLVTLVGSLVLAALGLPQDVLQLAGVVVLIAIGIALIVPRFEQVLERPFTWIPQRRPGADRGGFVLGLSLGAVYVPCAGPVLAAITVAGSTGRIGADTVVLTVTFALGAALPLLIFALAGRRVAERVKTFRKRQRGVRIIAGVVMIALAVGILADLPQRLQRLVPDYTSDVQERLSENDDLVAALSLGGLVNEQNAQLDQCEIGADELDSCGTAPDITGIDRWLNTPNGDGVNIADLRGQVVLLDFWAYSCINCQRSLPHVTAWSDAYRDAGLEVVGIHSPEYAFEKEPDNVADAVEKFGIDYPVALDNSLSTWTNYRNRYWPAHYLIDADGVVRHINFGEGDYDSTESMIRELLRDADPAVDLPAATDTADRTPDTADITSETFFGWSKVTNYGGEPRYRADTNTFTAPAEPAPDTFALDGAWTVDSQHITPAGDTARIRLAYTAREVQIVLSGTGTVSYEVDGDTRTLDVGGTPDAYRLVQTDDLRSGILDLTVDGDVQAYSFTFG